MRPSPGVSPHSAVAQEPSGLSASRVSSGRERAHPARPKPDRFIIPQPCDSCFLLPLSSRSPLPVA